MFEQVKANIDESTEKSSLPIVDALLKFIHLEIDVEVLTLTVTLLHP
jgi:hypothetical protein